MSQIIPADQLARPTKVLILYQLALGDFTYWQGFLRAIAERYPALEIHVWVGDTRRSWLFWRWPRIRQDALYQWLETFGPIRKIYRQSESVGGELRSIREARRENYPLVVSLCLVRPWYFAAFTRLVGPSAFRAGLERRSQNFGALKRAGYRALHARVPLERKPHAHISDLYAEWIAKLFGVEVPPASRNSRVEIPETFIDAARRRLRALSPNPARPVFFLNPYARARRIDRLRRCWPLDKVGPLIERIRATPSLGHPILLVNAPPEHREAVARYLADGSFVDTHAFWTEKDFFELPAMVGLMNLVLSVDTSLVHFASALRIPLVALMRHDNPEWAPRPSPVTAVIRPRTREGLIGNIEVEDVVGAIDEMCAAARRQSA